MVVISEKLKKDLVKILPSLKESEVDQKAVLIARFVIAQEIKKIKQTGADNAQKC